MISRACVLAVAMTACQLGGPTGEVHGDAPLVAAAEAVDAGSSTVVAPAPATPGVSSAGPRAVADASPDVETPDAPPTPDAALDADSVPAGTCAPPAPVTGCDPVCNTGCGFGSRCDVADTPLTGRCIGIWISQEGELCAKTSLTNNCAVRLTCHENRCVRLCYRDGDCQTGCCNVTLGGSGFRGCGPC